MKTHQFKFNPRILAVELPRVCDYFLLRDCISITDLSEGTGVAPVTFIEGKFELLGKVSDLTDEIVEPLVESKQSIFGKIFKNYKGGNTYGHPLESFLSGIESEIYWENPYGVNGGYLERFKPLWQSAQLRTFDKQRTLIFVKQ